MRRMDRYQEDAPKRLNRLEKNKDLYQELTNNPKYTNIADVTNANAYELNGKKENASSSRESYQQLRKYNGMETISKGKKELDEFNYLYPKKEKKIYDINSVLEDARKNRQEKDALDEKRKLKYTSYNIFSGVNIEELAKYREEKKNREATKEEEEIHDLMDTIASKTLSGEISKEETVELLSDLMATSIMDKVNPAEELGEPEEKQEENVELLEAKEEPPKELEPPKEEEKQEEPFVINTEELAAIEEQKENTQEEKKIDDSFYTKSMDLSEQDFETSDDFEEKGLPIFVKILIGILIIAILAVAAYYVYLNLN